MPRAYFLQRLSNRAYRRLHCIEREPVRPLSEADKRYLDHLYGLAAAFAAGGGVVAFLLAISWRHAC